MQEQTISQPASNLPNINTEETWKIAIEQVQLYISPQNFKAWFQNTHLQKLENGIATIGCPSNFTREWLDANHHHLVQKVLRNITKTDVEVIFAVSTGKDQSHDPAVSRYENLSLTPDEAPIFNVEYTQQQAIDDAQRKSCLNPRYIFDSFVVGPSNRLAHAAAQAVADNPGRAYNPLFIWGGVGLGKTHMIQAIGNRILAKDPNKKILYCPSETFLNEMVAAIRTDKNLEFRQNYRKLDLLIIDDIQFISEWDRAQEELFHTFNTLYESGRQIVLAADRPPSDIENLTDRLRSRFQGGMVADITHPDYELRLAIIKQKAEDRGILLPDSLFYFIAKAYENNIRELEGALMKIGSHANVSGNIPSPEEAAKILEIDQESKRKKISPRDIIMEVCKGFGVSIRDVRGSRRTADLVEPRQVSMYLLRKELGLPLEQVAKELNRHDHTTVLHAIERVESRLEIDGEFRKRVEGVKVG